MPEEYKSRYTKMVDEQRKKRRVVVNEDFFRMSYVSQSLTFLSTTVLSAIDTLIAWLISNLFERNL